MIVQQDLLKLLSAKPVCFNPVLARLVGSANAGLLLSQFLYWQEKAGVEGWFYRTTQEIEDDTCLSRRESDTVRTKLRSMGILEEEKRGLPCRIYYRINFDVLANQCGVLSQTVLAGSATPDATKAPHIKEIKEETKLETLFAPPPVEAGVFDLPLIGDGEWSLPKKIYEELVKAYPGVSVMKELAAMRMWLIANPTKRKTEKGITRFVASWLARQQDRGPRPEMFQQPAAPKLRETEFKR
jgi:hypothetical protein